MAKKTKYYVVWDGLNPGIYDSWDACQQQVKGYANAKYKSFSSKAEAEKAYNSPYVAPVPRKRVSKPQPNSDISDINWYSISVDAACSGNPGDMEYQGVHTLNRNVLFHMGPFKQGTNNVGEFLALVHALAMLKKKGDSETPIYSDSKIAIGWVKRKKANTKLQKTRANARLFELIARAEAWLSNNTYKTPIIKWETKNWGEIPADFGRK